MAAAAKPLLLDGGFATQCTAHGADITSSLWSSELLVCDPPLVAKVHNEYAEAGAGVVISASYQACVEGLGTLGLSPTKAKEAISSSVTLAREGAPNCLVAGSVGPYGAALADGSEYTAGYLQAGTPSQGRGKGSGLPTTVTATELQAWHTPRLAALLEAEPDLLACETLPCIGEVTAIAAALDALPGGNCMPVWVSFTLDAAGTALPSGESVEEAAAAAVGAFGHRLVAVGCNCVPPAAVLPFLHAVSKVLPQLQRPSDVKSHVYSRVEAVHSKGAGSNAFAPLLMAYPNAGEAWDAAAAQWVTIPQSEGATATPTDAQFAAAAAEWVAAGASIVGGCCRTTPLTIAALARTFA